MVSLPRSVMRRYPHELSGGQRQRVAIARALINQPKLIFADEPTGNLDSHSGQEVMMILHDIARDQGCSVVLVSHDQRVEDVADRILWLENGRVVEMGGVDVIDRYTRSLTGAQVPVKDVVEAEAPA